MADAPERKWAVPSGKRDGFGAFQSTKPQFPLEATEYARADILAAKDAEIERLKAVYANSSLEVERLIHDNARLMGALNAEANDAEIERLREEFRIERLENAALRELFAIGEIAASDWPNPRPEKGKHGSPWS